MRCLVAGELQHAGQQFAALTVPVAAPGIGTDRGHRVIGQQVQHHVQEGGAGRRPGQGLQDQRAQLVAVLAGQVQQPVQAVIACAARIMQIENRADRVTHAGLLAGPPMVPDITNTMST
ncbi:hypothetical protein D3C71_1677020 [compost metagenome]